MYRSGHLGLGFIFSLPIILYLYLMGWSHFIGVYIIVFGMVSVHPDIDLMLQRKTNGRIKHRGKTHTLAYGLFIGLIMCVFLLSIAYILIPKYSLWESGLPRYAFIHIIFISLYTGVMGIFSHILGDIITPSGLRFLSPWKEKKYSFNLVYARDFFANLGFFIIGILSILAVGYYLDLLIQSVFGLVGIIAIQGDKVLDSRTWFYKFRQTMETYFKPEFQLILINSSKLKADFEDGRKNSIHLERNDIIKGEQENFYFKGKIRQFSRKRRLLRRNRYEIIFKKSKISYKKDKTTEVKQNYKKSARKIIKEIDEGNYEKLV